MKIPRLKHNLVLGITIFSLAYLIIMTSFPLVGGQDINTGALFPEDVDIDSTGLYLVGTIAGALPNQTFTGGSADAYIRKYDHNGNQLWTRQFGTEKWDEASGVAVGPQGLYVVGNLAPNEAFLRKYEQNGTLIWSRHFGNISDTAKGVAMDSTGVYVVGDTVTAFSSGRSGVVARDNFIKKYDHEGNLLWNKRFGTWMLSPQVSVDSTGVYAVAVTIGSFSSDSLGSSLIVRKYDQNGSEVWTRDIEAVESGDHAVGVSVHATGLYVVGTAREILPGRILGPDVSPFVRKYDPDGNELWHIQFGTDVFHRSQGIGVDSGGVYVVGFASPNVTNSSSQTNPEGLRGFVSKFDHEGHELWNRQIEAVSEVRANAVAMHLTNVYVVGMSRGTIVGQVSKVGESAFVRTYDKDGNEVWTRQFGIEDETKVSVTPQPPKAEPPSPIAIEAPDTSTPPSAVREPEFNQNSPNNPFFSLSFGLVIAVVVLISAVGLMLRKKKVQSNRSFQK